jgi:hypothetical protein
LSLCLSVSPDLYLSLYLSLCLPQLIDEWPTSAQPTERYHSVIQATRCLSFFQKLTYMSVTALLPPISSPDRVAITKNSSESLIENNFAIPIWWTTLQATLKAILNKNISYESVEDPNADPSLPLGRYRSAGLVASLQISALQTLLSVYQSQFHAASSSSSPSSSSRQSLHFFSCPSIENGIIFGSLLSSAFKCLTRLSEFPVTIIRFTALRCASSYGELLSELKSQVPLQQMREVVQFCDQYQGTLNDLFQLWISLIHKDKLREHTELLRESITGMVRYASLEKCQSLQLLLHTKLKEEPSTQSERDSTLYFLTENRRREYTRGLLLCAQRNYLQTVQVIATAGDRTYVDLVKECGGQERDRVDVGQIDFFDRLWSPSDVEETETNIPCPTSAKTQVIANWISHLSGASRSPLNLGDFLDLQQ